MDFQRIGVASWRERDYEAAIEALDRAIELRPDLAGPVGSRALVFAAMADYDSALSDAETAVELAEDAAPRSRAIYLGVRGYVLLGLGQYADALADYEEVFRLARGPGVGTSPSIESLLGRGLALDALGDSDRARRDLIIGMASIGGVDAPNPRTEHLLSQALTSVSIPVVPGSALFQEDFNEAAVGWLPTSSPRPDLYDQGYQDGEYVLRTINSDRRTVAAFTIPGHYEAVSLSVDVRLLSETPGRLLEVNARQPRRASSGASSTWIAPSRGLSASIVIRQNRS